MHNKVVLDRPESLLFIIYPLNTTDTTQRAVLLMANVACRRGVVLVRGAGEAGGIFGIADIGCMLDAFYISIESTIPLILVISCYF